MNFRVCTRCVMDSSDEGIRFDSKGECHHCHDYDLYIREPWRKLMADSSKEAELVDRLRIAGRGRDYDVAIGLSGGVDSSFLALWAKDRGLRTLCVHIDAGWNSELATRNIENIVTKLGHHLKTIVIDWDVMRRLQLAYLRSGVSNQDVPQDHAFIAGMLRTAREFGLKFLLSGHNYATEAIHSNSWGHNPLDSTNLKAIFKAHGEGSLRGYALASFFEYYVFYPRILGITSVRPLNYFAYTKHAAMERLSNEIGWVYYGGKHFESRFTRFFQAYYLPNRFGIDKRKGHLSSQIHSGEITRQGAIEELSKPAYDESHLEGDLIFIANKLGIGLDEMKRLLTLPKHSYSEFANEDHLYRLVAKARRAIPKRRAIVGTH